MAEAQLNMTEADRNFVSKMLKTVYNHPLCKQRLSSPFLHAPVL